MAPSSDRPPPSAIEHVRLFRDLAGAHMQLVRLLPVANMIDTDDRDEYWRLVVRASSMRKFALQDSDNAYLPTVFDKMESTLDVTRTPDPEFIDKAREAFTKRSEAAAYITRHGDYRAQAMVEDVVYGLLIHGDYGRHQRIKADDPYGFVHSALFEWLMHFEDLLEQVFDYVNEALSSDSVLRTG